VTAHFALPADGEPEGERQGHPTEQREIVHNGHHAQVLLVATASERMMRDRPWARCYRARRVAIVTRQEGDFFMDADDIERVLDVDDRYQNWVYRNPVKGAALAGVIATQVGTIWGYYAPGIGLPSLPFPAYNGLLFSPASVAKDFSNFGSPASWFLGQSVHFANGIVFALLFALVYYNKLPTFMPKMKSVQKGIVFAVGQTIISIGFLFPYVYAPKKGFGFFSFGNNAFGNNPDHWKLPFAVLLWHLVYGSLLGLLYDPKKATD
jgi:hypothetical protein